MPEWSTKPGNYVQVLYKYQRKSVSLNTSGGEVQGPESKYLIYRGGLPYLAVSTVRKNFNFDCGTKAAAQIGVSGCCRGGQ